MTSSLIVFYSIGVTATLLASGGAYFFSRKSNYTISTKVLWMVIAASSYLFFAQYFKYQSLHVYSDFAHWLQVVHSIVTKGWPEILSHEFIHPGTLNYFSVHFVPLIYILAIPFKLIPLPETVIAFNVVVMISSAIPLYKLARRMNGSHTFALSVAALLLWYPTFQYITLYEFEMLRFSIPILLWMLFFFETRRTVLYLLFVVLAILVREEVGLTVGMFGIYAWLVQKRRREGLAAFVLGFGGFVLITSVLMPALSGGEYTHVAAGAFFQFCNNPGEILWNAMSHPTITIRTILHLVKIANIFMLGLPLLFLPLAAPSVLVTVANIGTGLLSDVPFYTSYMLYYIAPSVPFIFYALLGAWPKIVTRLHTRGAMNALVVAVVVTNIVFGSSPISVQFWFQHIRPAPFRTENFHWSAYRVTDHHRKAEEFATLIPDNAIVSTQQFLFPRLYMKRGVMIFPELQSKDKQWQAEYVYLDVTNNGLKPESPAYISEGKMAMLQNSSLWELIATEDSYVLYKKL